MSAPCHALSCPRQALSGHMFCSRHDTPRRLWSEMLGDGGAINRGDVVMVRYALPRILAKMPRYYENLLDLALQHQDDPAHQEILVLLFSARTRRMMSIRDFSQRLHKIDNPVVLEDMLQHGAMPDIRKYNLTRLWLVMSRYDSDNRFALAEILLRYGAHVNARPSDVRRDDDGSTPLENFSLLGGTSNAEKQAIITLFAQYGADLDKVLQTMIWNGSLDVIETMLQHGADPNKGLFKVEEAYRYNAVPLLLRYGADPTTRNNHGSSFLEEARKMPHMPLDVLTQIEAAARRLQIRPLLLETERARPQENPRGRPPNNPLWRIGQHARFDPNMMREVASYL